MQLECKYCHKLLNLPDDKLPVGRPFSFNCPYCKEKNTAEITLPVEKPVLASPQSPANSQHNLTPAQAINQEWEIWPPVSSAPGDIYFAPPNGSQSVHPSSMSPLKAPAGADDAYLAPDHSPLGVRNDELDNLGSFTIKQLMSGEADERLKALVVYDDLDVAEKLEHKLEAMGFEVSVAINQRDAARQLKFINFTLVLIQEYYFGAPLSSHYLLKSVQNLDGPSRRGMLVILISPTMTTLDDLLAFSLSLDAIINSADLDNIERILISTMGRARKFYSIFREVLVAEGLD